MDSGQEKHQSTPRRDTSRIVDRTSAVDSSAARNADWHLARSRRAVEELLGAFDLLAFRGTGAQAWAAPFRHDPIAFLLDTVSDAANLWAADERALLYQNRAAAALAVGRCDDAPVEEFVLGERRFERRCLRFGARGQEYILEIIHEVNLHEVNLHEVNQVHQVASPDSASTSEESAHGP